MFKKVLTAFSSYKFSVIYIYDQPIETVCEIFERINNSGKILDVVDLMVAKTWSSSFNLKQKLTNFQAEIAKAGFDELASITLLQIVSTNVQSCCQRKDILALDREQIEKTWESSIEATRKAIDFLSSELNIKSSKILPFNALLVPLAYFYFRRGNVQETFSQKKWLTSWFWQAAFSNRFDSSVETKIADDVKKIDEVLGGKEPTLDYRTIILTKERLIDQNYSLKNAFCKTVLCVYGHRKPRNLENNRPVEFNEFSKFNAAELHHLFPYAYLRKQASNNTGEDVSSLADSIVNIAFIHASQNKQLSSKAPSIYLKELTNPELEETMRSHLIPDIKESGLLEDNFEKFLGYRSTVLLSEINGLIGISRPSEVQMQNEEWKVLDKIEIGIRDLVRRALPKGSASIIDSFSDEKKKRIEDMMTQYLSKNPGKKEEDLDPLDFLSLLDYYKVIKSNWNIFSIFFASQSEAERNFYYLSELRNAIKHVRGADPITKKHGEGAVLWFEQVLMNARPEELR